ncbi:MAG: glycosyl hydrolase family 18 protein [Clostridia bacterium]
MRSKQSKSNKNKKGNAIIKIMVIILFLIAVGIVFTIAPNYQKDFLQGKTKVVINNSDVTASLKLEPWVNENGIVYLSTKDIANFFDKHIFYDNTYEQIITSSDTKLASIEIGKKEMYVNSSKVNIYGEAIKKDGNFYLPFSEMQKVYNIEVKYIEDTKTITIDSLDRKQEMATITKDTAIKYLPTTFAKTVDKVEKGNSVVAIEKQENGWMKVRTANGILGYTKDITNIRTIRQEMEEQKQIEGKVSLVWDYYSEYVSAPTRTGKIEGVNVVSPSFAVVKKLGKGELETNIGEKGKAYIQWAHNQGYKVWPMISNNSMKETTSEILRDYKLREKLINEIVNLVLNYEIDGINIDFENIYQEDKEMFSQFIIELAPRLREYGKVLSVDVTAPDGSEDWSLCYDRNLIGQVADYVVFMAYDQNGATSPKEGTTAGANWVEANIKKFVGTQEEVDKEKLIIGMPFYTRLWKEANGQITSKVVSMKNIDSTIPENVEKKWNEDLKQYYVEYEQEGATYKMWIEDENSIKAKFDLVKKYDLAGAAYWTKDREAESIWKVIAQALEIN